MIPSEQIYLRFNTSDDITESVDISRIYGGIHYMSSNLITLDAGNIISLLINNKFIFCLRFSLYKIFIYFIYI